MIELDNNTDYERYYDLSKLEKKNFIEKLEKEMREEARKLNFEAAMSLRDIIIEIKASMN